MSTFNKDFYLKSYEKHDVMTTSDKSIEELDGITHTLLRYLKKDLDRKVLRPFFNEREISHMEDVKILFRYGFIFRNICFAISLLAICFVIYSKEYKYFAKGMFYGIFAWWGLLISLFLLTMIDFTKYFNYFHLIFFDNDLWILNPETDLLIQMLPEPFFIGIFRQVVLLFMGMLAIMQTTAYVLMEKKGKTNGRTIDFKGLF